MKNILMNCKFCGKLVRNRFWDKRIKNGCVIVRNNDILCLDCLEKEVLKQ